MGEDFNMIKILEGKKGVLYRLDLICTKFSKKKNELQLKDVTHKNGNLDFE